MKVWELIEGNQNITDATIRIRKDGWLLNELNIGLAAGIKPPFPTRVPKKPEYIKNISDEFRKDAEYMRKSINAWDDGKDYWQVKADRIPKRWLDLEVSSWHIWPASRIRHPRAGRSSGGDYEHIYITTLPSGEDMKIKFIPKSADVELPGQMNILDFIGKENED